MPNTKSGSTQDGWHKPGDVSLPPKDFLDVVFDGYGEGETPTYTRASVDEDGKQSFVTWRLLPDLLPHLPNGTHAMAATAKVEAVRFGRIKRTDVNLHSIYAIICDDVGQTKTLKDGTEVTIRQLNLLPSWRIETRPGSFQVGYLLDRPVSDLERVSGLLWQLAAERFSDPGAVKVGQVFRLPGSHPPGKPYPAILRDWHPERVYAIEEIEAQLSGQVERRRVLSSDGPRLPGDVVINDEVLNWLHAEGYMPGQSTCKGFQDVICPWAHEHSDDRNLAGYAPPTHDDARRGFKCFHGHCADRGPGDFLKWVADQGGPVVGVTYEVARPTQMEALPQAVQALLGNVSVAADPGGGVEMEVRMPPDPRIPDVIKATMQNVAGGGAGLAGLSMLERLRAEVDDRRSTVEWYDVTPASEGRPMRVKATKANCVAMLRGAGLTKRLNVLTHAIEWSFDATWPEDLSHANPCDVSDALEDSIAVVTGLEHARGKMQEISAEQHNPAAEYLQGLPAWDGVDHIAIFVARIPCSNPEVAQLIMRKFFIQMVQAAYNYLAGVAGAKAVGFTPVFLGGQGLGKTMMVMSMAPPGMSKEGISLRLGGSVTGDRDAITKATRCWVGELGEVGTTTRQGDVNALKNFLTSPVDTYRPSYGRNDIDVPRSTVYAATSNEQGVLHDSTGDRRFGAIYIDDSRVGAEGLPQLTAGERDLLMAQALHLWRENPNSYFLTRAEQAVIGKNNEAARTEDPVDDLMHEAFGDGPFVAPGERWGVFNTSDVIRALYDLPGASILLSGMPKPMLAERIRQWLAANRSRRGRWGPRGGRKANSYRLPVPGSADVRAPRHVTNIAQFPTE